MCVCERVCVRVSVCACVRTRVHMIINIICQSHCFLNNYYRMCENIQTLTKILFKYLSDTSSMALFNTIFQWQKPDFTVTWCVQQMNVQHPYLATGLSHEGQQFFVVGERVQHQLKWVQQTLDAKHLIWI